MNICFILYTVGKGGSNLVCYVNVCQPLTLFLQIWFSSVGLMRDVELQLHQGGQYTSVLDYCHNLRELYVYSNGSYTGVDLWRPILSHPDRYKNVKVSILN